MKYQCPVCGYRAMPYPAEPYNICPCCGTEFGVDDFDQTYSDLRQNWIAAGMPWFDRITLPEADWSPFAQLIRAGFNFRLITTIGSLTESDDRDLVFDSEIHLTPLGVFYTA